MLLILNCFGREIELQVYIYRHFSYFGRIQPPFSEMALKQTFKRIALVLMAAFCVSLFLEYNTKHVHDWDVDTTLFMSLYNSLFLVLALFVVGLRIRQSKGLNNLGNKSMY